MLHALKSIIRTFSPSERRTFYTVVGLMFIAALLEMVSIGAVLPFISIIQDPSVLRDYTIVQTLSDWLHISSDQHLLIALLVMFVGLIVVKNLFTLGMNYMYLSFSLKKQAGLAQKLFSTYLRMNYIHHKQQNSSTLVRNVINETLNVLINGFLPLAIVISEGLVILCIVSFIFVINPTVALSIGAYGIVLSFIFLYLLRPTMRKLSKQVQFASGEILRNSQESFAGIKEIIVSNSFGYHQQKLQNFLDDYVRARTWSISLNYIPRAMFEITFMLIFASTIIIFIYGDNLEAGLPLLAVYAVAAFRLIPSLNRFSTAMNQINIGRVSLETIQHDIDLYSVQSLPHEDKKARLSIPKISLKNISFSFAETPVLKSISLELLPHKLYALTGPSGSGKTTLVDVVTGLLTPDSGDFLAGDTRITSHNKRSYINAIAYVPQAVHVADDSVRANVAYGQTEQVDDTAVWDALEAAHLADVIRDMPEGLDTPMAEAGGRLSGGQKHRLGIARAIYSQPDFLIMDEPTAALDKKSEKLLLSTLQDLKKRMIVLIVTHSPEAVKMADVELKLGTGEIL